MIQRSGIPSSEIKKYLCEAEYGLTGLTEQSPKDIVDETMKREGKRLKNFLLPRISEAEELLETDLIRQLQIYGYYFLPPFPRPVVKIMPPDSYYLRFASAELLSHPGFRPNLVVPESGSASAVEIEASFIAPFPSRPRPTLDLAFAIHYESTMAAFNWLFQEWRRPIGQLLRSIPNLELWGNGNPIELPKGQRTKDPVALLQHHFEKEKSPDDNMISMKCLFSAENSDRDIMLAVAVFLGLFDAIFRITDKRADADCILRHYNALVRHIPKAPFRKNTIFAKE